jgi:hypothetical protein
MVVLQRLLDQLAILWRASGRQLDDLHEHELEIFQQRTTLRIICDGRIQ